SGEWSAPALLSALRLEWRLGNEANAATLFYTLAGRPEGNATTFRAGLFMAASDVVRGRADPAPTRLARPLPARPPHPLGPPAPPAGAAARLGLAYGRGRLAGLDPNSGSSGDVAVSPYLDVPRSDPYHPLARLARARLAPEPLAHVTLREGHRLAVSRRPQDL